MPASVKMTSEITALIAGHGDVSLEVALATLAAAPGIVYAVKKLHIWEKLNPVEQHEIEMLDEDMPSGWWRRFKYVMPGIAIHRGGFEWTKGNWSVGTSLDGKDVVVTSPRLDEETGELVT